MSDSDADDAAAVRRVLEGDRNAFAPLVQRYAKLCGSVAYGVLGDFHAAADAVQVAYVKAYESLPELQDPGRFRPWLINIVKRSAIDGRRRRLAKRESSLSTESGEFELEGSGPMPGDRLEEADRQAAIREALAKLSEAQREVLAMKYTQGLSYKAMAEQLDTTEAAVESRLVRARQSLAEILKKKVG